MEAASEGDTIQIRGDSYWAVRVLRVGNAHVADAEVSFEAPLPVFAGPEGNAWLDGVVEMVEFVLAVQRVAGIGIDVVRALIKDIGDIRAKAENDADSTCVKMISKGTESVQAAQQVNVSANRTY